MHQMFSELVKSLDYLPPDENFSLKSRADADERPFKIDLSIGAYRDQNGKPWVLPSVRAAEKKLHEDADFNHEYLNIWGFEQFTSSATEILFGKQSGVIKEGRIISLQSVSGTGALSIAAKFFNKICPDATVYISDPTWTNHSAIFGSKGFKVSKYPYWDVRKKCLDIVGFLRAIESAPENSIFVLHTCAHNPTGVDPTEQEWDQIIDAIIEKNHIPLFDTAYQGFASGDLDRDAYVFRLSVDKLSKKLPIVACQSFSKNIGMYGERVGVFHLVLPKIAYCSGLDYVKKTVFSNLNRFCRSEYSNPPAYGAKIVTEILNSPELTDQWRKDLHTMYERINTIRHALFDKLIELGTPGDWSNIIKQCGMFSYTGLTSDMVRRLEKDYAIYMPSSGRISIPGLNESNIEYCAKSIDAVVRHFSP